MADLDSLYSDFYDEITLSRSKRDNLTTGRNAIRKIIKDHFMDEGQNAPKFRMQGSFAMKTTVNPIDDNEYDLDDGVYLQGYSDVMQDEWPLTRKVHGWVCDAVIGHTKADPEDKTSCVRVRYENGYHIDLPSYIIKNNTCYLASKKQGWIESDPKAFKDWFLNYVVNYPYTYGEQLRRTVKYLKAWRDYCNVNLESITVTILAAEHFNSYSSRDDKAVYNTVVAIVNSLSQNFSCHKPVTPFEELLDDYSDRDKSEVLDALKSYRDTLLQAINEKDEKEASLKLRSIYGKRFPEGKSSTRNKSVAAFATTAIPGVIGNDGRSA